MTATATHPPSGVEVDVLSFSELFEVSSLPLAVDTYQRGFVWPNDKIRQLADDLAEYERLSSPKPPYYMGTVLLHRDKKRGRRFVIDGQQRLTALCVLHQQLKKNLPDQCAMTYSPRSARQIRGAARVVSSHPQLPDASIFGRIVFTVINVQRVDQAFTFFDTQNNRGVPLHATDLLKAYHLRAVDGPTTDRKEAMQALCARRWEGIQQGAPVLSHDQEYTHSLFAKFLWRARYWTGKRAGFGGHDALMTEFQVETWPAGRDHDTVPLYRARHNRLATALTVTRDGHGEIHSNRISLSPKPEELPFAIRQPIQRGLGFFLYADKYAALLRRLIVEPTDCVERQRFRDVYNSLVTANSLYLREVFLLCALVYSDQFGDDGLFEFSLWLEHALGTIRIEKQQVRYEAAQNFFKDGVMNLLDVIANGFRPEQVIAHLKAHHTRAEVYDIEKVEPGKGVQGVYKQAVLAYYRRGPGESLQGKEAWISARLAGGAA